MRHTLFSKLSPSRRATRIKELEVERDYFRQRCVDLETQLDQCDYQPVPPSGLRVRVGGWEDADHFLGVGRKIFWDLKRLLKEVDKRFDSFASILDFGCGCGRVLRFLKPADGQAIAGTDIDPESITWCRQHLGHIGDFQVNDFLPPLSYPDETFDLVYCISVFTHLPEGMQFQWLEELKRITKESGILVASLHGVDLLKTDPALTETLNREGFVYVEGQGTDGLPSFYQTAFHTREYLEKNWSRFFEVLHYRERGINNHQDVIVCEKR